MIVKWDGRDYRFDTNEITVKEAEAIREHTGFTYGAWDLACRAYDDRALTALLWVIKKHNGEDCDIAALDFKLSPFIAAYEAALVAEIKAKEKAAGPKGRTGSSVPRTGTRTRTSGTSAAAT